MKKLILMPIFLLGSISYAYPQNNPTLATDSQVINYKYTTMEEKRKELWKAFHKIRFNYFGKFQEINLYAENDSLTKICFICDKGLFIFYWNDSEGRSIEKIEPAKLMLYGKINRITFEHGKKEFLEYFILWYYETKELSIGAN